MDLTEWHELFTASAGASAALVGLIIVAMSVNIEVIVKYAALPSRAAATISALTLVVVVSIAALIPKLPDVAFGLIAGVLGLVALAFSIDSAVRIVRDSAAPSALAMVAKSSVGIIDSLPFVVGGVLLCFGNGSGVFWVAAGILLVFIGSILNAWVLLVEIRR